MAALTILYVLCAVCFSLYFYLKWTQTYWKRKGIYTVVGKKKYPDIQTAGYFELKNRGLKHGGYYRLLRPIYLPVDLDLIRSILVKKFDHFVNRGFYFNEKYDPLSMNLVNVEDEKWKNMRMKLTPTFTSGKMKMMFPTMKECATGFLKILEKHADNKTPLEMKQTVARLTLDVIGTIAFGIDCKAIEDENSEFKEIGKEFSTLSLRKFIGFCANRQILTFLRYKATTEKTEKFFMDLVNKMIHYRDSNNIYRNDFFQQLLELRYKGQVLEEDNLQNTKIQNSTPKKYMSIPEIAAQCVTFFGAGFETSSVTISFTLLELALNPDVQDKLRQEIQEYLKKHDDFTYEGLMNELTYLDQVVDETLRRHPPARGTQRICKNAFQVPETDFILEPGTIVIIPILGIHMDPEYYPNPKKFDPERFSPENKAQRPSMTFIPFGEGPRICIGVRFAYLQIKIAIAKIINEFKVTLNDKTIQPFEYDFHVLTVGLKGGIWLNFTKV